MTNSARLSGRPSSSAAYNVGDVVDTPDSAIKSWRYLGAGEWEPNDAVRYTTGPGGGNRLSVGGRAFDVPVLAGRYRTLAPSAEGQYISDLTAAGAAVTLLGISGGTANYDLITLPDGSRKWGLRMKTKASAKVNVDFAISRAFAADDVIEIDLLAERGQQVNVYLTANNLSSYLRLDASAAAAGLKYTTQPGIVTMRFARSSMSKTGTVADDEVFNLLRVNPWNTTLMHSGEVVLLGVRVNRKERPRILFTTDDGLISAHWLAEQLKAVGCSLTANIITERPSAPPAGYMSWEQVAALKAIGNVQIASHSHAHIYVNGGTVGTVYGSTVDGVALSQTVAAGALLLNGTIGSAAFDKPRHITLTCTGAKVGISVDVVGELNGAAVTETMWMTTTNTYPHPSVNVYDKITSLTVNLNGLVASGTVKFGTSCSYDEIYYDIKRSFDELESRGLIDERHYCAPQGQWNHTLWCVLKALGVKTCRLTDQAPVVLSGITDMYALPAVQWEASGYANAGTQVTYAVNGGQSLVIYTHEISEENRALVAPVIAQVGALVASGAATSPTIQQMYAETEPSYYAAI